MERGSVEEEIKPKRAYLIGHDIHNKKTKGLSGNGGGGKRSSKGGRQALI